MGSGMGFEERLREVWLKGMVDDDLDNRLEDFGKELEVARQEYESIKNKEKILSDIMGV